jgi:3-hydroxyacyl-[acyl-carrier-protein] dehydratase
MTTIDITTYIPQRPPFVMIDELINADNELSQTCFTVSEGHLFVDEGYLSEAGIVENMAQTAAAGVGYKSKLNNKAAPVGYIGALKNLSISELPKVGSTITTQIIELHRVLNASIVSGKVFLDNREIASCEFKIFIQSES